MEFYEDVLTWYVVSLILIINEFIRFQKNQLYNTIEIAIGFIIKCELLSQVTSQK